MDAGATPESPIQTLGEQMIALLDDLYNRMQYVEGPNYVVTYDDDLLYREYFEQMRGLYAQWAPAEEDAMRGNLDMTPDAFRELRANLDRAGEKIEGIRSKIMAYRRENEEAPRGGRRRKTLRKRK